MQKKKLLVLHPIIGPYRIDFFNALNEQYDFKCCLFMHKFPTINYDFTKIEGQLAFKPIYLDVYHITKLGIPKGFFKILEEFQPDFVMLSECSIRPLIVHLYKLLFRKKFKTITLIDDSYDMAVGGNHFSKAHALAEKIMIPMSDEIVTVEPRVNAFFQKRYGKGIYFPIVANEKRLRALYEKSLPLSYQYIKEYNLEEKKVLLFVGRLIDVKNVKNTIKAFIKANIKDVVFVIVGDGAEMSSLKEAALGCSSVIFTGMLEGEELYAWYNVADVHILASYQEPFGAVTNEALIAGCYSVVSKKAGSQCLVKDGVNGFTVDPNNLDDIANGIIKAFNLAGQRDKTKLQASKMLFTFEECSDRLKKGLDGVLK